MLRCARFAKHFECIDNYLTCFVLLAQEEGAIVGPASVVMEKGMHKLELVVIDLTNVREVVRSVDKKAFPDLLTQTKLRAYWEDSSQKSSPPAYLSELLPGLEVPCRVQSLKLSLLAFFSQSVRCMCRLVGRPRHYTDSSCCRRVPKRLWQRHCRRTSSSSPVHCLRGSMS